MSEEQIEPVSEESAIENTGSDDASMGHDSELSSDNVAENIKKTDPASIQKRLGMQAKKHSREIRALHDRIAEMTNVIQGLSPADSNAGHVFNSPGQPSPVASSEEERIQHAIRVAMDMKAAEERKAHHEAAKAHVHQQYQRLADDFEKASEKYDDFHDVVMDSSTPFTHAMKDTMLLIDNAPDVAYRLAKNKSELERISKLHPLDQAREVTKLSFSLMNGRDNKQHSTAGKAEPLNMMRGSQVVTDPAITDRTSSSAIRERMKKGTWK